MKQGQLVSLNLSEFIQGTIESVVQGVVNAQNGDIIKTANAKVNPAHVRYSEEFKGLYIMGMGDDETPRVELIEFDILVTLEKGSGTSSGGKGGVDIKVLQSSLGTEIKKNELEGFTNKIRFSIPVKLPQVHGL